MAFLGDLLLGFQLFIIFHVCGSLGNGFHPRMIGLNKIDRSAEPLPPDFGIDILNRSSFPPGFVFGAGNSAYQVEGGWNNDGKGLSNWDYFTHNYPGKIANGANGDEADDSYHRYKEDVKLLKQMNADSYRFSISWSRLVPSGKVSKGVNEKGIQYYNNLINELLDNGLTPAATIFHWELPQALEEEYGGFLSSKIVEDFCDYANLCFERFGDRVKLWITLNEPFTFSQKGYDSGETAPGRCSLLVDSGCRPGNSATEPYIVTHHQLLARAHAVELYRAKFQASQKGKIGMTNVAMWMVAATNSGRDQTAAGRARDFMYGWFLDPLVFGDYPASMKAIVRERLPKFTPEQSKLLKGSYDFHGLNYYTAQYASHPISFPHTLNIRYSTDNHANLSAERNGMLIGEPAASDWLHIYPAGLFDLLLYIKDKYQNPVIYITENGVDEINNSSLSLDQALQDSFRIRYHIRHLQYVQKAIQQGVKVEGYYGWSLIDNFEWQDGYSVRYGTNFVDFKSFQRYRKLSSFWFQKFLLK